MYSSSRITRNILQFTSYIIAREMSVVKWQSLKENCSNCFGQNEKKLYPLKLNIFLSMSSAFSCGLRDKSIKEKVKSSKGNDNTNVFESFQSKSSTSIN